MNATSPAMPPPDRATADRLPALLARVDATGRAVALRLAAWGADDALQAAGALHVEACDEHYPTSPLAELVAEMGDPRTQQLVEGWRNFHRTSPHPAPMRSGPPPVGGRRGEPLVLQLSHAYCTAYADPELAFLYAAVLWERFERARARPRAKKRVYLNEARLLLVPLLEMLGMRELRTDVDNWLARQTNAPHAEPPQDPDFVFAQVAARLRPQTDGWARLRLSPYTQTHSWQVSSVSSLPGGGLPTSPAPAVTIDVLVDDEAACYRALYHIQQSFTPIEGGVADNLKIERVNGYRGLSATVWANVPAPSGPDSDGSAGAKKNGAGQRVRVRFRMVTPGMDEVNRWGLAAFLLRGRKEGEFPGGWWRERSAGLTHIRVAEPGAFPEILYVFSPLGQLFEFRRGCTVVDYAYHVHSVLADHCVRFYVNGRAAEPTTVLHHLDLVNLEHDAHAPGPTMVWLNAARTGRARTKIDGFLRRRGRATYQGQKKLDQAMAELEAYYGFAIPEHRVRQAVRDMQARLNLTSRDEFLAEIASGRIDARRFLHRLFGDEIVRQIKLPSGLHLRPHQMRIAGCCWPRLGDPVVGHVKRRGGNITKLKIHHQDCSRRAAPEQTPADRVELKWRLQPALNELAQVEMTALDGDRLLGDAVAQVYAASPRVILHRSLATARNGVARITFTIEAESREVLERIAADLRTLPDRSVDRVRLLSLPPSEQEEIRTASLLKSYNPYSRLPVRQQELFFGRQRELGQIADWLRLDDGNIWLRGQKRVGKTSLLLHLQQHYLSQREFIPVFVDFQQFSPDNGPTIFYSVANAINRQLQASDNPAAARIDEVGPPLKELFALQPSQELTQYLRTIQSKLGQCRLVLLLDEFSRTIDAWQQGRLDPQFPEFFVQLRGMMLNTPGINCVTVVQQQTYDRLRARPQGAMQEPVWELLELGEQLTLRPLDEEDVRRLIEWPMQDFLDYTPETVDHVVAMTGGSPFLAHAFCSRLTMHMTNAQRRQVTHADVEAVAQEFMQPNESLFAHMLDMLGHGMGNSVAQRLADLAHRAPDRAVDEADLCAALPAIDPGQLRRTLAELCARDIVEERTPAHWRFCSQVFQRWLTANPIGEGREWE